MNAKAWFSVLLLGIVGAVLAAGLLIVPNMANARTPASAEPSTGQAAAAVSEVWKLGVTLEGASAYANVAGRVASAVAAFRSNHGVSDIYYAFPAAASSKTVQSASFYLVARTGAYGGTATLTLEVLNAAGALQHTVSAAGVDLQTAPTDAWTAVALSGTPANLVVDPGEFLAFHFQLSGAPGGNLDVRPVFEVVVY